MSRSLVLLGAMLLGPVGAVTSQQQERTELREAELARFQAQVRRDTAALQALLSDDLVYVHSNGLVETKSHFIESIVTQRLVYDSITAVEVKHRVYGATAVGNGKVHVQVQMNGKPVQVDLIFTTVHVRQRGRWQLVAWQSTRAQ